jgi:hypothetical protein
MSFRDSAIRHYDDGQTLFTGNRYDNADQLFGFATECAIKACLLPRCFSGSNLHHKYKVHIDTLWCKALLHVDPKSHPGLYALLQNKANPFANWTIENRYQPTGGISSQVCEEHHTFSQRVLIAAGIHSRRKTI